MAFTALASMPAVGDTVSLSSASSAALDAPDYVAKYAPDGLATNDASVLLGQATILNWLGQSPISFHRIYVDITGSVVVGLWLSHVLALAANADSRAFDGDDFVFTMSARDCEAATGITRAQQVSCRTRLAELGFLTEAGGQRKTPTYRLHMALVARHLLKTSEPLASAMSDRQAFPTSRPVRVK
ncbi:hypothetical protein G7048_23730 [Diaphorobacter sp. HDW4B]|uniref:hypothetical protein n=1 Tax=Diaphorobacter sp. HDW4B TaxID=2714925 RepID=UPI00140C407F|nr:hypothetical protein [Diaphorobacter sp. HDW4B]QIL73098.1 hypothetical protein G7048_23730 [Diaphorobacter sp. HDW4B]